jgi:hypothetical protein
VTAYEIASTAQEQYSGLPQQKPLASVSYL